MKQSCPRSGQFSQTTLRDNRPTSAFSALILNAVLSSRYVRSALV